MKKDFLSWVICFMPMMSWANSPAPHDEKSGSDLPAHHVRLSGQIGGVNGKMHEATLKSVRQLCQLQKNDPGEIPKDQPMIIEEVDIYYGKQANITYKTTSMLVIEKCAYVRTEPQKKAKLLTAQGVCNIDITKKKASKSHCDVERLIVANKDSNTPPSNEQYADQDKKTIAGHACTVFSSQAAEYHAASETCVLTKPTGFQPFTKGAFGRFPGLVLAHKSFFGMKERDAESASIDIKATAVEENIRVSKEVFLPHLSFSQ
jgi:hypothetical protein